MVALNFDATAVPESTGGYELLQPGEYRAEIVAADVEVSKKGHNYLKLQVKVEGSGSVWDNLNLWNPNPSAVEVANDRLKQIARALNMPHVADSDDILLKPLLVKVNIEAGTNGYADKNVIVSYSAIGSVAAPAMAEIAQAPVPPSAPIATTAAPAPTTPTPMAAPTSQPVWRQG
tara:strand:+ start:527 stop:1051 length:525 start_codon:yes stop_codon:yes gene_type:complete